MKTTAYFVLCVLVFSVQACNPLVNDDRNIDSKKGIEKKISNLKNEKQSLEQKLQQQKDDISAKKSSLIELEWGYLMAQTQLEELPLYEAAVQARSNAEAFDKKVGESLKNAGYSDKDISTALSALDRLTYGSEEEMTKAQATLATFKDQITEEDIKKFRRLTEQVLSTRRNFTTDEKELETLRKDKTPLDKLIKNFKKLEKELADLQSAEQENKNKIAAVTKQLDELEKKD
uniref:Lipoprotein n=1 Tax=Steinernema glaseri TaxID=37863 RepID=A0A1I8AL54_9BILA